MITDKEIDVLSGLCDSVRKHCRGWMLQNAYFLNKKGIRRGGNKMRPALAKLWGYRGGGLWTWAFVETFQCLRHNKLV